MIYCSVLETSWNKAKNKENLNLNLEGISTVLANWCALVRMFSSCPFFSGTQRPNVSKHVWTALIVFFCLEACLVEAALIATLYLFGCRSETFYVLFSSAPRLLATLMGPVEWLRTWSSLSFTWSDTVEILMAYHSKVTHLYHHRHPSNYMYSQTLP